MKSAFVLLQAVAAAFVLTFTFGCAPPAPTNVNTSTEVAPAADSNMTTSAEAPTAEAPAAE